MDEVTESVRDACADVLEVRPESVTAETDLWRDLEADSLDLVELYVVLEDRWGSGSLDKDEFALVRTVADVTDLVRRGQVREPA